MSPSRSPVYVRWARGDLDAAAVARCGATVYTFSIILAVFLIEGIGSGLGSLLARTAVRPRLALALPGVAVAAIAGRPACSPARAVLADRSDPVHEPVFTFQLDVLRCAWPSCGRRLWVRVSVGVGGGRGPGQDAGRLVGGVYAANTVGAIWARRVQPGIHSLDRQAAVAAAARALAAAGAVCVVTLAFSSPHRSAGGRTAAAVFRIAGTVLVVIILVRVGAGQPNIAIPGGWWPMGAVWRPSGFSRTSLLGRGMNA